MNEQEMEFADPDWRPGKPLPHSEEVILPDPTASQITHPLSYAPDDEGLDTTYARGYRGVDYWSSSPSALTLALRPTLKRLSLWHSIWWMWMVVALLLLVLLGVVLGKTLHVANHHHRDHVSTGSVQHSTGPGSYALNGASDVAIANPVGSITVQVASNYTENVVVKSPGAQANVTYMGNSLFISSGDRLGNLTVVVPQNVVLHLRTTQGTILVDGFNGQMSAQSDTGSITLNHDNLEGESLLSSYSGDIHINQGSISGLATLNVYAGSLALSQEKLSGHVVFRSAGDGDISFQGTLDPLGKYQFSSNNGQIDLHVPADTAMKVEHISATGSYHSDFSDATGTAPLAEVIVQTGSGSITIQNRP